MWDTAAITVDTTVVVVTYRGRYLLPDCLASLACQSAPHRVLVVDNGSSDGTSELLAALLDCETFRPANLEVLRLDRNTGFAGGVAAALEQVHTTFVALLNDDAQADPHWLAALLAGARDDAAGAAWTSLMLQSDHPELVQNAGAGILDSGYGIDLAAGAVASSIADADVFGFCGGAALLRTAAVRAVGGFPAEFFLYYEDLDTSWRLRLGGWQIRRVAAATVRHEHSATSDQSSELFHFYNERNRLLTLLRCAPWTVVLRAHAEFLLASASITLRMMLGRPVSPAKNLQVGLRLRVYRAVLAEVPQQLAARARIGRGAAVTRQAGWQQR